MSGIWVAPTLDAAVERLAADPEARPIAAGVGVLLARELGAVVGPRWVAVGGLAELQGWRVDEELGTLAIGAATTVEALADGSLPGLPPLLAAAARSIANPGVRAVATVGGNVVAGGPSSDLAVALAALGAEAELRGAGGKRFVAAGDLAGSGSPAPGELAVAFRLPGPDAAGWGWERLTVRGAMDRSVASVAVQRSEGRVRVVVGCIAGSLVRLSGVEAALASGAAEEATIRATAATDLEGVAIADDDRVTSAYRRRVVPVLVARAVRAAFARE